MNSEVFKIRQKRRRKKNLLNLITVTIILLVIFFVGRKFTNLNFFNRDKAEAGKFTESLKVMGENDPINKEVEKVVKKEEIKKAGIERERAEIERKRLEEEEIEKARELDKDKKIAYLTFDDGPSAKSTPRVLDILKKYDIKATFFVVGNMIEYNPGILKRTYEEGHKIGNHSYGHDYKYLYANATNFMNDIYKNEELIKQVVGNDFDSKVIRFPGGSFEKWKDPMLEAANEAGYRSFDWNALNGDAEGGTFPEAHLLNRLKNTVGGQKKVVILMHDTDAKASTANSLEDSIKYLISQGYEFRVLDKNVDQGL